VSELGAVDVMNHELFEALGRAGCPLCDLRAISESRIVSRLVRDIAYEPAMLDALTATGGLCRRHGRLFHACVAKSGSGGEIVTAYGALLDRDLAWLDRLGDTVAERRASRPARRLADRRPDGCYACSRLSVADAHHQTQMLELLGDPMARERYATSDGLCIPHLVAMVRGREAASAHPGPLRFAVEDAYRRLRELRRLLGEYDRKRDPALADQREPEEERALTRVVRRYIGHEPSVAEVPWDPGLADW
jgi:hypothetical protein